MMVWPMNFDGGSRNCISMLKFDRQVCGMFPNGSFNSLQRLSVPRARSSSPTLSLMLI